MDVDAELLGQLADQRAFGGFAGLDLAARKFPLAGEVLARLALGDEDAAVGVDQRRGGDEKRRGQPARPIARNFARRPARSAAGGLGVERGQLGGDRGAEALDRGCRIAVRAAARFVDDAVDDAEFLEVAGRHLHRLGGFGGAIRRGAGRRGRRRRARGCRRATGSTRTLRAR